MRGGRATLSGTRAPGRLPTGEALRPATRSNKQHRRRGHRIAVRRKLERKREHQTERRGGDLREAPHLRETIEPECYVRLVQWPFESNAKSRESGMPLTFGAALELSEVQVTDM